ncbi:MAG: 6,7-dimethyl-8-ribityllumazine synthase [Gemmatimonadaceae bacterium]|nr:6,7-dimethyl-8-ribityllumazine synthase [Gemmatimonadaceae bacterium]MCW5824995.1 6,7-dimethyl-8-ribityllumazine synthase [Gemmatimonadaceae bacterium]
MPEFIGVPTAEGRRVVIVVSRFNEHVTQKLADGALECCLKHGAKLDDVDVIWVPGAWELPPAVMKALQTERYDCAVAVGAVIRGETPHFDFVAGEANRGLALLQGEFGVPIGMGVLTTDTMAQAEARAGGAHGNKGWDAALAALEMADLFGRLDLAAGADD